MSYPPAPPPPGSEPPEPYPQGSYPQGSYPPGSYPPAGYPPGSYPPGPYPPAPGSYGGPPPRNGMGIAALILGLVSIVGAFVAGLGIIPGVLAIIFGGVGYRRSTRGEATNRGIAIAGIDGRRAKEKRREEESCPVILFSVGSSFLVPWSKRLKGHHSDF